MKHNKIINDPVHGFIEVPKGIFLQIIDSPIFQRLRRIQQLALSSLVYPGAIHTRFNHCIGAMHLTRQALNVLRNKGAEIEPSEYKATLLAILLHDIGHGPFSHALESVLIDGMHHETMSLAILQLLNEKFEGQLSLALDIFEGNHPKKYLHQLVSSQLDMDRMDYLKRDAYFTGVVEGQVNADRIIKTLLVHEGRLMVEEKGIYSVEQFIVARRLMYWQVYLHKAVLSSEYMIVNTLKRARKLIAEGKPIWRNDTLDFLFNLAPNVAISPEIIKSFTSLDDYDILYAIKQWQYAEDKVLRSLSSRLLERRLLKVRFMPTPPTPELMNKLQTLAKKHLKLATEDIENFVFSGEISNLAYLDSSIAPIEILQKDGSYRNISTASDLRNIQALSGSVTKHFICLPEEVWKKAASLIHRS